MSLRAEDQGTIRAARAYLNNYSPTDADMLRFGRNTDLCPKRVAQAALDCAPTQNGKLHMAKMIMDSVDKNTGVLSHDLMKEFAVQIFNILLVPCMFLYLRY
jgi:hypothetical protein